VQVTVHIPGPLLPYSRGQRHLVLDASTVREALAALERSHPAVHRSLCDETGAVRRHVNLFVNRTHLRNLRGLETPLANGDVINVIPAVSGG
jgi:molybdopterin synthase sulfur carrier subunit